jgi:hypothetical protein
MAFDLHPSLVLLRDAVNRGQSEAGALPDSFRREKGLKNPAHRFQRHAASGVGHTQADKLSGTPFRVQAGVSLRTPDIKELSWPQLPGK